MAKRRNRSSHDRDYNAGKKGKARLYRWRKSENGRTAYLAYLRRYHRTKRRKQLKAMLQKVQSSMAELRAGDIRIEFLALRRRELEMKLEQLDIEEKKDEILAG